MVRKCKTERSAKRQKLIQDSLLALMHSHRYEEIPVSAICVQAGIPRRTFYNHFDSKDEVLDSVLEDLMLEINLESMFGDHGAKLHPLFSVLGRRESQNAGSASKE